jgi:nucleoside-diphosphate-sugar epimerase
MKILLTGGTGFIGSYLKTHLTEHEVYAPARQELDLLDADAVKAHLQTNCYNAVIHTAVVAREQVKETNNPEVSEKILTMFDNFYQNRHCFTTFINFGSGAEFGLDNNIENVSEDEVVNYIPKEGYGFAKNQITRKILETRDFYNLRLFSCLDSSEPKERLLKRFLKAYNEVGTFEVDQERDVDFFSLHDVAIVVNAVLAGTIKHADLNLTYPCKLRIGDTLAKYCAIHKLNPSAVRVTGLGEHHYTGSGCRLKSYNLPLEGMDQALRNYKV